VNGYRTHTKECVANSVAWCEAQYERDQAAQREREAKQPMLSPREHYAAATRIVTEGLDRLADGHGHDGQDFFRRADHLLRVADVHSRLALVPQGQFDAWKAESDLKAAALQQQSVYSARNATYACERCGRPLFTTDAEGHVKLGDAAITPGWSIQDGGLMCLDDDPAGCRGTGVRPGESIRRRRPTLLPSGEPACEHGRNVTRCRACHPAADPQTICPKCLVACWNPMRTPGSRCDLPGCDGLMTLLGDPRRPIREAPVEVVR
jgi:hypothetical protein